MANSQNTTIDNGVKLLGETFLVPGSSLILDGRVGAGLLHGALGLAAISLLGPVAGPVARLLISANSYSRSISDRSVLDVVRAEMSSYEDERNARRATAATSRAESGRKTGRPTPGEAE